MTLGEVIDAQKRWATKAWASKFRSKAASSAAGAAQFMRATLIDLSKELSLSGAQPFNPDFQDRLAFHLLQRRGYDDFVAGKIDVTEFGKNLAQEWASFPVLAPCRGAHRTVQRGETYYAGDGLNKALVDPVTIERVLANVLAVSNKRPAPPTDAQMTAGVPKSPPSHDRRRVSRSMTPAPPTPPASESRQPDTPRPRRI